jgi:hypothetical protein
MVSREKSQNTEIDCAVAELVERLLRAEFAIKRIQRTLREAGIAIHRRTIRRIKRGKHVSQTIGPRRRRCPGCGGKQLFPCRVCAARALNPAAA